MLCLGRCGACFRSSLCRCWGNTELLVLKLPCCVELSAVLKAPLGPTLKQLKEAQSAHSGVRTHWELNGASSGRLFAERES